jgi:hypothetical protein
MSVSKLMTGFLVLLLIWQSGFTQSTAFPEDSLPFKLYPQLNEKRPDLPSPWITADGKEYVLAVNRDEKYAIMEVTLSNEPGMCPQLVVDSSDFPELVESGLHEEQRLDTLKAITGRSLEEITRLARPNGLSQAGFLAEDEDIISVIKGDNRMVRQMGLTHPQLAKPLFQVLNMMEADLQLKRWNMAIHKWDHIRCFFYNDQMVQVEAEDTKGGQKSIFEDGIEGAFYIKLWRELSPEEDAYLKRHYASLSTEDLESFKTRLCSLNTGEMQPQYIMRYGFYEGHTYWRADPIALAFIFGLRDLQELDQQFGHELDQLLARHHTN